MSNNKQFKLKTWKFSKTIILCYQTQPLVNHFSDDGVSAVFAGVEGCQQ